MEDKTTNKEIVPGENGFDVLVISTQQQVDKGCTKFPTTF